MRKGHNLVLLSDGAGQHSERSTAAEVATLCQDMAAAENHIMAALGVDDGGTDFHRVFREMGLRDEWILTVRSGASDIRRAFQVFSQAAVAVTGGVALPQPMGGGMGGFMVH